MTSEGQRRRPPGASLRFRVSFRPLHRLPRSGSGLSGFALDADCCLGVQLGELIAAQLTDQVDRAEVQDS